MRIALIITDFPKVNKKVTWSTLLLRICWLSGPSARQSKKRPLLLFVTVGICSSPDNRKTYPAGSVIHFHCSFESEIQGSRVSSCLPNGQWSHPLPNCVEGVCVLSVQISLTNNKCSKEIILNKSIFHVHITRLPNLKVIRAHYRNLANELPCSLQYCPFSE